MPVVNVDAAAKAASRTTVMEPELDVRNTLVLLTAEHDFNRVKKEHLVDGVPEARETKAGIRARASSAARETMMWDAVPTEEAHAAAADFEGALDTVFGEAGRLPRDAAGEERWARALHTLSGRILKPGTEAMRAAVQRLAKLRGRRRNERLD